MSFLQRLFGRTASEASPSQRPYASTQFAASQGSRNPATSVLGAHRDVLRVVLRETLNHNGIPAAWLSAETLIVTVPDREPGIHLRLLVTHWDPRLLSHSMAFQQNYEKRLQALDPSAASWLKGISWQYALPADAAFPRMPHPGSWTATAPEPVDTEPRVAAVAPLAPDARADLEKLFAIRDADMRRHSAAADDDDDPHFAATVPAPL